MKRIVSYWTSPISKDLTVFHDRMNEFSHLKKMIIAALLGTFAAIFQSAGVFSGIGYLFSPLASGPILLTAFISGLHGLLAYTLTILLLVLLQPSELIVFPFTTGLLGLGVGLGLKYFKRRIEVIPFGALLLCIGISIILYIIQFPVLGPAVDSNFSINIVLLIYVFSFFYCWIWVEIGRQLILKLRKII